MAPREEVTFVRLEHGPFHDGVKFANGHEVSLQQLKPGVTAVVTRLLENEARSLRATAMAWLR